MNVGVLLAAGTGTRLCKDLELTNKCLMRINDKSFLINTIEQLFVVCDLIYIAVGHNSECIYNELVVCNIDLTKIVFVQNYNYDTTNNITSMHLVLDKIQEDCINLHTLFYAESDIWYFPKSKIFESMSKQLHDENVRCSVFSESGKSEWYIDFVKNSTLIKSYVPCDRGGQSVIGAAMFTGKFVKKLQIQIKEILSTNDQIYWDEAERLLLKNNNMHCYILDESDILEIDTANEFYSAKTKLQLRLTT